MRVKAKSISFGSMSEEEFHDLFSKVIDVGLAKILPEYSRSNLEEVINQILGFT